MIEALRHLSVFHPEQFGDTGVDIIGCGATGSKVAMSIAKLGVENIRVWDDDEIEEHNPANQLFGNCDIGQKKVEALARRVKEDTGIDIEPMPVKVEGSELLHPVVFLLTDTMSSRKDIWEGSIRLKPHVRRMIETRMGADEGRVYSVCPCEVEEIRGWEGTLYADEESQESLCGARTSVGPTSGFLADLAVWQFMRWFAVEENAKEDKLENEILFSLRPSMFVSRAFS